MSYLAVAQHSVIGLSKMNAAYADLHCPIRICVEKQRCDSIIVTTDNGTITYENDGNFELRPEHIGNARLNISLKTKEGAKFLQSKNIRVNPVPMPVAGFGRLCYDGTMEASVMKLQIAPAASYQNLDIEAKVTLYKFTVVVIRDSVFVFEQKHFDQKGCRFDSATHAFFATLQAGDKVWITDISGRGPACDYPQLDDIFITLK
jgi:hypothetical protein